MSRMSNSSEVLGSSMPSTPLFPILIQASLPHSLVEDLTSVALHNTSLSRFLSSATKPSSSLSPPALLGSALRAQQQLTGCLAQASKPGAPTDALVITLRGLGFVHASMGHLDRAEAAYAKAPISP